MKKCLIGIICALFVAPAYAATLVVSWNDPTPRGSTYVPTYFAEYRITTNGVVGGKTAVNLTAPSFSATVPATAADIVEVRYKASNVVVTSFPVSGEWSEWYTASPATTPSGQTAPIFTVIAY